MTRASLKVGIAGLGRMGRHHATNLAQRVVGAELVAACSPVARRVFAAGMIAVHEGLREAGDVDNAVAAIEFVDGQIACIYASRTMAHGHETLTEIVGTASRLMVGHNPRLNRVEISDAGGVRNECTPTFYERFAEAFLNEAQTFIDVIREDRSPPLTLRDATEATRIGIAVTESLRTKRAVEL